MNFLSPRKICAAWGARLSGAKFPFAFLCADCGEVKPMRLCFCHAEFPLQTEFCKSGESAANPRLLGFSLGIVGCEQLPLAMRMYWERRGGCRAEAWHSRTEFGRSRGYAMKYLAFGIFTRDCRARAIAFGNAHVLGEARRLPCRSLAQPNRVRQVQGLCDEAPGL